MRRSGTAGMPDRSVSGPRPRTPGWPPRSGPGPPVGHSTWEPPPGAIFDLVLVAYLHLADDVLRRACHWLAPGGALVVVGHALRNLTEGVGGPSDARLLHTEAGYRAGSQ